MKGIGTVMGKVRGRNGGRERKGRGYSDGQGKGKKWGKGMKGEGIQ